MNQKGVVPILWIIVLLVLVAGAIAGYYFLYQKPTSTKPSYTNTSSSTESTSSSEESYLEEKYDNPFDEKSSYSNPFSEDEYQNPFEGL